MANTSLQDPNDPDVLGSVASNEPQQPQAAANQPVNIGTITPNYVPDANSAQGSNSDQLPDTSGSNMPGAGYALQGPIGPEQTAPYLAAQDKAWANDLQNGHITPETYQSLFAKQDTLGKIGTIAGLLVGTLGSGINGQNNAALGMMDKVIQNDLQAQRQSKTNAYNFLRLNQQHQQDLASQGLMGAQSRVANSLADINADSLSQIQMTRAAFDALSKSGMANTPAGLAALNAIGNALNAQNSNIAQQAQLKSMFYSGVGGMSNQSLMQPQSQTSQTPIGQFSQPQNQMPSGATTPNGSQNQINPSSGMTPNASSGAATPQGQWNPQTPKDVLQTINTGAIKQLIMRDKVVPGLPDQLSANDPDKLQQEAAVINNIRDNVLPNYLSTFDNLANSPKYGFTDPIARTNAINHVGDLSGGLISNKNPLNSPYFPGATDSAKDVAAKRAAGVSLFQGVENKHNATLKHYNLYTPLKVPEQIGQQAPGKAATAVPQSDNTDTIIKNGKRYKKKAQ